MEVPNLTHSKDMIVATKLKSRDIAYPHIKFDGYL